MGRAVIIGRPDFSLLARQQRSISEYVGETAQWRRYVSADTFAPSSLAAGIGAASYYYQSQVITGLFSPVSFDEIGQAGGYLMAGDMRATLVDALPGNEDEVVWRGVAYRVVADPLTQQIVGASAKRFILRRGQGTGG